MQPAGSTSPAATPPASKPHASTPQASTPLQALAAFVDWLFLGNWHARLAAPLARLAFLLVGIVLAGFLSYKALSNQITATLILQEDRVSLASYVDGTAEKPFTYRVLTPALMRLVQDLHVPAMLRAMPGPLPGKLAGWCSLATSNPRPSCDTVTAYAVVAGAQFFVFLLLIYAVCLRLFDNPVIALFGLAFTFWGVNAVLLLGLSHLYDFGAMMFATLLLLCLQRGWSLAFTLVMPLAFMTKETLVLYAGSFFLAELGRSNPARTAGLFLVQMVSFGVIYGLIMLHYEGNPGAGHEYYLGQQISFFTEQLTLPWLILFTVALVLVFYRFAEKDRALRRASIVILPWFALAMIGGYKKELRVVFEVLPLLLLFTIDSVVRLVRQVPRMPARAD